MRILFVTSQVPFPPNNGVRIVSYNAMRLMHDAGHQIALMVLDDEGDDADARLNSIMHWCEEGRAYRKRLKPRPRLEIQARAMWAGHPYFVERYRDPEFSAAVRRRIDEFKPDVVHFDLIVMAQFRVVVPESIGTVASINDSYALTLENELAAGNHKGLMCLYKWLQLRETKAYERRALELFDVVHTMTEIDASYLRRLNPKISTASIPNGVDESLFEVGGSAHSERAVLFVARLVGDNLASLERFLNEVWPTVLRQHPQAALHVVGSVEPESEKLVATARGIQGVSFLGYVEDLAVAYAGAGIAIVPIDKNCGIVNKAIEAMAAGLAVVGYSRTLMPIEEGVSGVHFVGVDSAEGMASAISQLLADPPRLRDMQRAAYLLARQAYRWETRREAYDEMYRRVSRRNVPGVL